MVVAAVAPVAAVVAAERIKIYMLIGAALSLPRWGRVVVVPVARCHFTVVAAVVVTTVVAVVVAEVAVVVDIFVYVI